MGTFLVLVGLIGICWGLVGLIRSFFKKGNKKRNFIIIGIAFILMIFGASISPTSHSDSSKASTQSEKKIETKRTSSTSSEEQLKQKAEHKEKEKRKLDAERKKQEEEKQKLEAERKKQEEEKQKLEAERKKQEEEKQKIEAERKKQEEEKQKIEAERKAQEERQKQAENEATTALSQAEAHPTRENYNSAATLIQAIPNGNQHLSARLATVDATIKANEAAEAERQRQAAAAQEQANQVAAAQTPQQNNEQTVYIAPDHGTKYHLNPNCSGLNNANSVVAISLQEAQARGYTLCKRG
ncbi:hypothetical protein ACV6DQ_06835 [Enterococcus hirae]|uniref:Uncharacterized protein n=2 Tax=Enterococcus hirae TaxID=1354 RepID=I6T7V2_ENTHA|nr:hypothetical protein [Enterococcus hirae]AFM70896.1 hypothetical protein EHR_09965 [Enterococcus hirae ATCC 9790]EOU07304.1 hypothetical protein I584_00625 [Enterococcus hirae ATCC 9790]MBA5281892.1 hypothetical protein [Enterococcus hirae]QQY22923.1 hypothetical protein I6I80_05300 [Enterococcus hirae]VTQ65591.1 Serine/threonine-protein kinase D [Enterococcus hirae]